MQIKKSVYIALFTLLGVLVSFLIHAGIEIPVIYLLVSDFETYGLGLTFSQWFVVHDVFSVVLLLLGIFFGFQQGARWWKKIYGENM